MTKALITGSVQGLGRAIALDLAAHGFDIALHYRSSEAAARDTYQQVCQQGSRACVLQADLTDFNEAQALVHQAAHQLDGLSVIINCVGNFLEKALLQTTLADWHAMLNSNLHATFYTTQTALPYLQHSGQGRILNFACVNAQYIRARRRVAAYMIAKTGVVLYTQSLALELKEQSITANVIAPGLVENSIDVDQRIRQTPAQRAATLQDIAHIARFLVSPTSHHVTGQVMEVAGGWQL